MPFGPETFGNFTPRIKYKYKTFGPKTFGPKTFGPKTFDPKTIGPKTFGPKTFGTKTFAPRHLTAKHLTARNFLTSHLLTFNNIFNIDGSWKKMIAFPFNQNYSYKVSYLYYTHKKKKMFLSNVKHPRFENTFGWIEWGGSWRCCSSNWSFWHDCWYQYR